MNQLDKTEKKVVVMMIGGIALLIAFSFVWDNYQEYQKRESGRRTCEKIKKIKDEITARINRGEDVSDYEINGVVQLRFFTTCDCKEIRKIKDEMTARINRGEDVSADLPGVFHLTETASCGKQRN
jgi:hypothetical protein